MSANQHASTSSTSSAATPSSGLTSTLSTSSTATPSSGLTSTLSTSSTATPSSGLTSTLTTSSTATPSSGLTSTLTTSSTATPSSGLTSTLSTSSTATPSSGLTSTSSTSSTATPSSGLASTSSTSSTATPSSGLTSTQVTTAQSNESSSSDEMIQNLRDLSLTMTMTAAAQATTTTSPTTVPMSSAATEISPSVVSQCTKTVSSNQHPSTSLTSLTTAPFSGLTSAQSNESPSSDEIILYLRDPSLNTTKATAAEATTTTSATSSVKLSPIRTTAVSVRRSSATAAKARQEKTESHLLEDIRQRYPKRHSQTYFSPPLKFNTVPYDMVHEAGLPVLVPKQASEHSDFYHQPKFIESTKPRQPHRSASLWSTPCALGSRRAFHSNVQEDATDERLFRCLRVIGEQQQEAMMVLTSFDFDNVAGVSHFDRHRGEFDFLLIHRHYGFIVWEVKSAGAHESFLQRPCGFLEKRISQTVHQLNKAHRFLADMLFDLAPVRVTKVMVLPYISSWQALQALSTDPDSAQAFVECIGASDLSEAVSRCLFAGMLPSEDCLNAVESSWGRPLLTVQHKLPWLRGRLMGPFADWWQRAVSQAGPDCHMTDEIYDRILARFIGLAAPVTRSDVSIHVMSMSTESQSVAEVGDRMSRLCLYPDQLRILHTESPCVFLHAPPGCGKTVMLCLKAINWLKAGHNVHIIIVCHEGHAVSRLIEEQTKQALGTETPGCGTVTRLTFDLGWDPQGVQRRRVIRKLRDAQSHNRLHLIMDEVNIGEKFIHFLTELHDAFPSVCLWAASIQRPDFYSSVRLPDWLQVETLTIPVRSSPSVVREIKQSGHIDGRHIPAYTFPDWPVPTDGLPVRRLKHRGQQGHCHGRSLDCVECGRMVGRLLRDDLEMGREANVTSTATATTTTKIHHATRKRKIYVVPDVVPAPYLEWRDAIIVCGYYRVVDSPKPDLILGLEECGVPVKVVNVHSSEAQLEELALRTHNCVIVTDHRTVSGLQRKVVVGVGSDQDDRLYAMSRCNALLIHIDDPED